MEPALAGPARETGVRGRVEVTLSPRRWLAGPLPGSELPVRSGGTVLSRAGRGLQSRHEHACAAGPSRARGAGEPAGPGRPRETVLRVSVYAHAGFIATGRCPWVALPAAPGPAAWGAARPGSGTLGGAGADLGMCWYQPGDDVPVPACGHGQQISCWKRPCSAHAWVA